jgi:hypothetical protein
VTPETIYAASKESLNVPLVVSADPTGDVPQFALSAAGASAPGSFVNGAWSGTWDPTTQRVLALTPLIGGAAALVITAGNDYDLWARITAVSEVAVWPVRRIICPG